MVKRIALLIVLFLVNISTHSYGQNIKNKTDGGTIHIIGNAHMDMNWLWTYSETMQMCNDNLRQVVAFLDECPDFKYTQSQAAVYNFVEMVDPPLFEKVKKYVKEGRIELAGGMWVESDVNLSSGEGITRSFLLGQHYFQNHFSKMANIGWLPDNFGHISQMPQILKLAGCDYFYFQRCRPYEGTFWWKGSDNSTVLTYGGMTMIERNNSHLITPDIQDELKYMSPDKNRIMQLCGVSDHGGGPTRADIELIHKLDKTPGYPAVKFTTASDFFRKSTEEMDGRPTHKGEMQFVFEGCYTTVADIKEGNRNCENELYASEFFNTLRWLHGDKYPSDELRDLWTTVTFNQFHDILPGTCFYESNKEIIADYSFVMRKTTDLRNNAFRKMADEVKFQAGIGQPVVAYNLQPVGRKAIVEANVYSHVEPITAKLASWGNYYGSKNIKPVDKGQGDVPTVLVRDASGKTYPAQVVWGKSTPPGFTSKIQFVADNMPAGGYKTFYIDVTKPGEFNETIPFINNTFDTDYFTVKFDMKTGGIVNLFDKRTKKEFVREGEKLNTLRISLEDTKGGMPAWIINKFVSEQDVTNVISAKIVENGPVRACVETVKTWGKSKFVERTYIYRSYPRIDYDMEVHWFETRNDSTDSPMLRAVFPIAMSNSKFYSQVPFDVIERPVDGMIGGKEAPKYLRTGHAEAFKVKAELEDGQEVPAQKWTDVTDGKIGIALLNKTKYGYSYHNGDLRLTLLRTAGSPDIYPNVGKFNISYSLFPHSGDWKNGVWLEGEDFNIPVYAAEPPSLALVKAHSTRPEEASFFFVDAPGVALSGIKQSEDGNELIVRLAEIEGKSTTVNLTVPVEVALARRLNILEFPLENVVKPSFNGKTIHFKIEPHEIVTLGITTSE